MLIALTMLSLLLGLIFAAFGMSTRIFSESSLRQSSEQQLKAIRVLLERDLELTNFWLTNVTNRDLVDGGARDGLSMVGLSEWNNASLYQSDSQRPAWDRQLVWYATTGPTGKLVRQVAAPAPVAPSTYLDSPYQALSTNLSDSAPEGNADVLSTRYLSEDVLSFNVSQRPQNATIKVGLHLRKGGGANRTQGMAKVEDHFEVIWTLLPKNTWPPL